jgi:hypothetical protein
MRYIATDGGGYARALLDDVVWDGKGLLVTGTTDGRVTCSAARDDSMCSPLAARAEPGRKKMNGEKGGICGVPIPRKAPVKAALGTSRMK